MPPSRRPERGSTGATRGSAPSSAPPPANRGRPSAARPSGGASRGQDLKRPAARSSVDRADRPSWGGVARRGARQLNVSGEGAFEDHRSKRPPAEPDRWVRDETARAPTPDEHVPIRPRAELPGDVAAGIRNAAFGLTTRARERLVTNTAEAVEAYNRGRYEEAARLLAPVAEVAPNVAAVREVAGLANYRARRDGPPACPPRPDG